MAGRRPKPTTLKLVKGTARAHRLNKAEPKPERTLPARPKHLSVAARAAWDDFTALLDRMGVLTVVDGVALGRACECYAEVIELEQTILEVGRFYETETGAGVRMIRAHPAVAMHSDADRRLKSYLVEFGMSPAARSKVKTSDGEPETDPAEKFFTA